MRRAALAGAAVAFATAVLAACGSSGDGPATAGGTPSGPAASAPAVTGPAVTGPSGAPDGDPAGGPEDAETPDLPKVPADEITPATGTFSKPQKEYLTDRVPQGMDPAAVLQTGQETCDRLRYLVKADRDIAVAAVVTGEVADAEPAVAHLCPRHQDLVDEAALGYPDGTHTGAELRPGRYRAPSPTKDCAWRLTGAKGRELAAGSSDTGRPVSLTVPASATAFTSTGCYAWLPEGATR
ncbi:MULTISPECIES: hypothetical protein [unclassified Streptomyces]|uniref:hypothetical protein n=1 Tax=unclassified Streptomyces TaxID=2593676 RepID=UPI00081B19EE|nr:MULTISPECIES: hypothetical protein [unclassified Streptomyces]MYQ55621.1 hypothetical protein [Streptomyces sp. SID4941]SCE40204.1 hypothetical protein GA0115247_139232 [Streptomyces sp. PalvLS-984]SDB87640.1 hypothetical protein F558DRAFT_00122 [Streptomyces sp. AmelKG-A3]